MAGPTVHILSYGRVLCGSIHGLPCNWGPQHKWAFLGEEHVTCATCKEVAEKMLGNVPLDVRHVPIDVEQVDAEPGSNPADEGV